MLPQEASFPGLEQKVLALAPQFVRVFYNDKQATRTPDKRDSFIRSVKLAQRADATINVTWQAGGVATAPGGSGACSSSRTSWKSL